MPLSDIIPIIWSSRFLANLDKALIYGNAANRDYQPDATYGSAINVHRFGDVTVGDYLKNTDIASPETLSVDRYVISLDQQKYFNFFIDSIDEIQSQPNLLDKAMQRAAYAVADVADQHVASLHAEAGNVLGTPAAPVVPIVTDIYAYLTDMAKMLDESNVPVTDRFLIMDPAGIKLLKDSGEMLSDTPAGDTVRAYGVFNAPGSLPMGYKGHVAGFDLFMSNNTPTDDASTSVWQAGHPDGISYVDSFSKLSGYQPESLFGEAMKGLYVFGAKVTSPASLVSVYTALA